MVEELDPALAEVRELYFQECAELLSDSGSRLARLEANLDDIDPDEINAIFRAVHSVKGGGGPWGLTEIVNFAHVFESTLGGVRDESISLTDGSVGVLVHANDILIELVEAAQGGEEAGESKWKDVAVQLRALTSVGGTSDATTEPQPSGDVSIDDAIRDRFQVNIEPDVAAIELEAISDLSVAGDLRDLLAAMINGSRDIIVGASKVERVTTPCVQVLISCSSELEAGGYKFRLQEPSQQFCDSLIDLGFENLMEKWMP